MMKKILVLILSTTFLSLSVIAQSTNPSVAVKLVKDLYLKRDFNGGRDAALKLLKKFPDNLELNAWYAINLARSDDSAKSIEFAEKLVKEKGENLWTLLALTVAETYNRSEKAVASGEKLIKVSPANDEAIFAYANALFVNQRYEDAVEFLEKNRGKVKDQPRFLTNLAMSTYYLKEGKEKGNVQKAFDLFAQAIKLNPNSVNSNYLYGRQLTAANRVKEAIPYLQKSVQLAPYVKDLRIYLWRRIETQPDKTDEQKKLELKKAIYEYLTQTKNSPEALLAAWNKYRDWTGWKETAKPEDVKKRDYYEKIILRKYPNSRFDEEIAFTKIQTIYGKYFGENDRAKILEIQLKRKSKRTPEDIKYNEEYQQKDKLYQAELIAARRAYLKRPKHFDKFRLGRVYLDLLSQIAALTDSTEDEISYLLKGALEHNKDYMGNLHSDIARVLLGRLREQPNSLVAKESEKYARMGVGTAEKKVSELPKDSKPEKVIELKLPPTNTLADVLVTIGKLDEAETVLMEATQMKKENASANFILDQEYQLTDKIRANFYTAKKDWEKAEEFYVKSVGESEDVVTETFEKFYEKKTGKKDGFAEYFAGIQVRLGLQNKEKVLQSRIKTPQKMIPFKLKTLDEKVFSSETLTGKVVVINFWGVWCKPCVAEMPELQQLFEKYKDDKEVSVLTIDSNDTIETVRKFIEERKYTFPVLIDDNYISRLPEFRKFYAFPTTLFIDKSGNVSYVVVGASSDLLEKFSWRIDHLKQDK